MTRRAMAASLLGVLAVPVGAGDVPNSAFGGPAYYATRAMDEIRVTLSRQDVSSTFAIPRSYVIFAVGYTEEKYPQLPQVINTHHLKVSIRLSTGLPHVASPEGSNDDIRLDLAHIDIQSALDVATAENRHRQSDQKYQQPSLPGLTVWKNSHHPYAGYIFYPQQKDASFTSISCYQTSGERVYCQYNITICPHIMATARFVDFRYHGGIEFAEQKSRVIRKLVQSWVKDCK